jgi:valyl-tRNA synthetase
LFEEFFYDIFLYKRQVSPETPNVGNPALLKAVLAKNELIGTLQWNISDLEKKLEDVQKQLKNSKPMHDKKDSVLKEKGTKTDELKIKCNILTLLVDDLLTQPEDSMTNMVSI